MQPNNTSDPLLRRIAARTQARPNNDEIFRAAWQGAYHGSHGARDGGLSFLIGSIVALFVVIVWSIVEVLYGDWRAKKRASRRASKRRRRSGVRWIEEP